MKTIWTLLVALVALPLAGTGAVATPAQENPPSPRNARFDLSEAEVVHFVLPAGGAVRGALGANGVDLEILEDGIPKSHGFVADCYDPLPHTSYWVPVALLGSNTAPACVYDIHTVPADEFYFTTWGNWYGWADAYDHATGSYVYMECFWYGTIIGDPWGWWTDSYNCWLYWYGVPPPDYSLWDSLVGNEHDFGDTYIAWY